MYVRALDDGRVEVYSLARLHRDNPNVSFPSRPGAALLAEYGVYPVTMLPSPPYNGDTEHLVQAEPALVDGKWVRGWTVVPLTVDELAQRRATMVEGVKREASKRILSIAPDYKQRNMLARSVELLRIGEANLTQEQRDEVLAIELIWETIQMIRAKSDLIEAMDPIPPDYTDDKYWT
jgi:uncharacterized protein YeaC (DUF1315 family)